MTNREVWEEAAGYGLETYFFARLGIDPNAEAEPEKGDSDDM